MIIGLLLFLGLMHLCGIVPILLVIAEVEFPSIFERYWKSAGFVGKNFCDTVVDSFSTNYSFISFRPYMHQHLLFFY